ncbi:MAG: hypothetical protein NUV45_09375 [Tepidanaerobacteraceae bacterium]|jgi:hypothetical protein|nr:hypothetical protein [Tepidanaerobacteraceae bacterium]
MKKSISVILCVVVILSISFSALAKDNVSFSLEENMKSKIRSNLDELSIDRETQDKLIKKLERGELWDSMNPEKVSQVPIRDLTPSIDKPVKRVVFEDGSVIENKIDFSEATIKEIYAESSSDMQPKATITYYKNVKVSGKKGTVGGGFYADYYINWDYDEDGISAVRDSYINVVGGSYSNKELKIVKSRENASGPAEATLTADISYGGYAGETFHFKMYVGHDKMVSGFLGEVEKP